MNKKILASVAGGALILSTLAVLPASAAERGRGMGAGRKPKIERTAKWKHEANKGQRFRMMATSTRPFSGERRENKEATSTNRNREQDEQSNDNQNQGSRPMMQFVPTVTGIVASVSGNIVNITDASSTAYAVDAANAKLMRKFGGKMVITDVQIGDRLDVLGTTTGTTSNALSATIIRDESLQAVNGEFEGQITAVNGTSFTLLSMNRGSLTINTTASTSFAASGQATTSPVLAVGQRVHVAGVWDTANSNVTALKIQLQGPNKGKMMENRPNKGKMMKKQNGGRGRGRK